MYVYLNSFGTYLHVKDAMFEIRVPDKDGAHIHHIAARKVKSIVLTTAGALSSDAIRLAMMHNVDLIIADRSGMPLGRWWHAKLGSTTKIRRKQLEAGMGRTGLGFVRNWLRTKLERQGQLLRKLKKHRKHHHDLLNDRAERIESLAQSLATVIDSANQIHEVAETLRGLEGTAGRLYFQTLSTLLLPDFQFDGRSFRPARDPFNAFLNYGYGVLYGRVEKALMVAGLDPYVGFMHRDDYNQKSLVFDFIEPYRPWIDRVVFRLFSGKHVRTNHYRGDERGLSLDKPGKVLLVESLNTFLDGEKIRHGRRNRSRGNIILAEAHQLAQKLLVEKITDPKIKEI
ncbi:MAG: CRISPR-associated endonuclease Cas1 [Bacteroidota bacterium]